MSTIHRQSGNTQRRQDMSLDLAIIGNGSISALVDKMGTIVWSCFPRFDGDPIFCALIHSSGDSFRDALMTVELDGFVRAEQNYVPGTALLQTRLYDEAGHGIEITDFAPRFTSRERIFRPAQLVRRVRPLCGHPRVRFIINPRGDWGRVEPAITRGSHHLRYVFPDLSLRLTTSAPATYLAANTWFTLDSPVDLLLGPDESLSGGIRETARDFEEQTSLYWQHWTRRLALPLEWQEAVIRSAITLKLCQFEETGAIVAAMTTSIPEAPDSGRNWDYRFCWLRDAFFVVRALNSLSEVGTMEDYLRWLYDVLRSSKGGHVQPLYGIGLEQNLHESIVTHVSGYRGMGPVRVGNQAYEHLQNDVYGNIVLGAAQAFHDHRLFRRADANDFVALEGAGEMAWKLHDQPDAGMWELRTRARIHTSSALMCWAACDRLAKIARVLGLPLRGALWHERATVIHAKIIEQCWNEKRQSFVESFGGNELDASVLLMAETGFLPSHDPRFRSTVLALEASLGNGSHMRRYEAEDDFGRPQTAFNVCSFWRVDALARIGEYDRAREHFEALLTSRNPAGLLSEDVDPATGTLWGNFPQTYSMVGIINGAVQLSKPWSDAV